MIRTFIAGCALAAALFSTAASATQYITNGNFSSTSASSSRQMSSANGQTQYVDGWYNMSDGSTAGYNFIVKGNDGTTPGGITNNGGGTLYMWSKYSDLANAASNGFTSSASIGGSGGNYLAADGVFQANLIVQTISNLVVGQKYDLSFNFAGAQQHGYNGATTEGWTAYFGTTSSDYVSYSTPMLANVEHGFTGWQTAKTTFTATSTNQYLAFLAKGTPDGQPPFSLLDDVSLTEHIAAVPEPASWLMMIGGFGLVGATLRRGRRSLVPAA